MTHGPAKSPRWKTTPGAGLAASFRDVIDGPLQEAVVLIDEQDRVVFFNQAAERLWGRPRHQVIGCDCVVLQAPAALQPPATVGSGAEAEELSILRDDGSEVRASLRKAVIETEGRRLRVAVLQDLSDDLARRDRFQHLSLVADSSDRAMLLLDDQHRIIYTNPAFTKLSGYPASEVIGMVPSEFLVSPDMDEDTLNEARHRATEAGGFQREILSRDKWGRERWLLTTVNPVLDDHGRLRNVVLIAADITQRRRLDQLQRDAQEALASDMPLRDFGDFLCRRVEAMAPEVVASILLVDQEQRLRAIAAPSLPHLYTAAIDGMAVGEGQGSCGTAAHRGEPVVVSDIATDPLWVPFLDVGLPKELKACWSSPIKRRDGRVIGAFAFYYRERRGPDAWHQRIVEACLHLCMIAIERHEAKAQIAQLAHFDPLTGLPNRTRFFQDVAERLHYHADSHVACIFLDMDRFKDVNETLGHAAGDQLLILTARRLQQQFYAEGTVYRLGGDEFLVLLPDCNAVRAAGVAERVQLALADPLTSPACSLQPSPASASASSPATATMATRCCSMP